MSAREELHNLIDRLPEPEVPYVRRFLEYYVRSARDPVLHALDSAPLDDESETEEEHAATLAALDRARRGEVLTSAEVKGQFDRA